MPKLILQFTTYLADDALIFGQRLSHWCSRAPSLEEDLALSNVTLDVIGRANLLYEYAASLDPEGKSADDLAFLRDERQYLNQLIYELPINDFGFTMVKQFFIDQFNVLYFEALQHSKDTTLAGIAAKATKESQYHLRRSKEWMLCLGNSTQIAHQKASAALHTLWPYTAELFHMTPTETALLAPKIGVDKSVLQATWLQNIQTTLAKTSLTLPQSSNCIKGGRDGLHTEHLGYLLGEMQHLPRSHPGCQW